MSVSKIKGWCPGAYHPMQSGDGLVFRVRPVKSSITRLQAIGLGQLALRYGSGLIDLTNRANLQIRGVPQHNMQDMIDGLAQLDLLDPDPAQEQRRNILVSPFWQKGDNTDLLETRLRALLPSLPEMPAKIGYAIDTSDKVMLRQAPADFRFERAHAGLILRADGCDRGRNVTLETAMQALQELVGWFTENRGDRRRMATAAREIGVPPEWQQVRPAQPDPVPEPGAWENGNTPRYTLFGAPFGQIGAEKLIEFAQQDGIDILRMTPWRMLAVQNGDALDACGFVTDARHAAMRISVCQGAPACHQSSVITRVAELKNLDLDQKRVHISGCDKGCAHPRPADVTLVGRDGAFDLVQNGVAWDRPVATGLSLKEALKRGGIH